MSTGAESTRSPRAPAPCAISSCDASASSLAGCGRREWPHGGHRQWHSAHARGAILQILFRRASWGILFTVWEADRRMCAQVLGEPCQ